MFEGVVEILLNSQKVYYVKVDESLISYRYTSQTDFVMLFRVMS